MRSNNKTLIVSLLAMFLAIGCVKKRPGIVEQGSNIHDLIPVEGAESSLTESKPLANWDHTLTIKGKLENDDYSAAEEVLVEENKNGILFNNIVDYETTSPLLQGKAAVLRILGPENKITTYKLEYELTPYHLVVYKVTPEQDLTHYEKPYSKQKKEGRWLVPIASFDIKGFFNVQFGKNADNRDTNIVSKFSVPRKDYKTANYFSIDKENPSPFKRLDKEDVLPREFFAENQDWYFHETIVDTNYGSDIQVGALWGVHDVTFSAATRVRFIVKEKFLFAVNANIADELLTDENNLEDVATVKISANPFRSRLSPIGLNDSAPEEERVDDKLENTDQIELNITSLETAQSKFNRSRTSELLSALGLDGFNTQKTVKKIKIDEGYIQFFIEDGEDRTLRSYAFYKVPANKNYQSKRSFRSDEKIFGFYGSKRAQKHDYRVYTLEDTDKNNFITRHNPNKDIVYHFSKQTPKDDWYRNIGRETINLWQQAFKKAGLKINIRVDESFDVDLGDIRYNIINITPKPSKSLAGFGPFTVDTKTGEIISANLNVYVDNMINGMHRQFRKYVEVRAGIRLDLKEQSKQTVLPKAYDYALNYVTNHRLTIDHETQQVMPIPQDNYELMLTSEGRAKLREDFQNNVLRNEFMQTYAKWSQLDISSIESFYDSLLEKQTAYPEAHFSPNVHAANGASYSPLDTFDKIVENNPVCSGVKKLIEIASARGSFTTQESIQYLEPCVKAWGALNLLGTSVHEAGHNLGLRHNFQGSFDQDNFLPVEDFQLKYIQPLNDTLVSKTSAIMDYMPDHSLHVAPGSYEIAAIRWAYGNKVEATNGEIKSIDPSEPIDISSIKKYLYCTDEQRIQGNEATCQAHDEGASPVAAASFLIENFFETISSIYRFNRLYVLAPEAIAVGSPIYPGTFTKLRRFYDQWRYYVTQQVGLNNKYLETYKTAEDYNREVIQPLIQDPKIKEYFIARNMVAKFFLEIAFLNNKYCLVTTSNSKETKAIELEKIRSEMKSLGYKDKVSSCYDESVIGYLKDSKSNTIVVEKEVGYFLSPGKFTLDRLDTNSPLDFYGVGALRSQAITAFSVRHINNKENFQENFAPSMLDEPDIRNFTMALFEDRLLNGVRLRQQDINVDDFKKETIFTDEDIKNELEKRGKAYYVFSEESNLISQMLVQVQAGISVPLRISETAERLKGFNTSVTTDQRILEQRGVQDPTQVIQSPDGRAILFVENDARGGLAHRAMQKIRVNQELQNIEQISDMSKNKNLNEFLIKIAPLLVQKDGSWSLMAMLNLSGAVQQAIQQDQSLAGPLQALMGFELQTVQNVVQQNQQINQMLSALGNPNATKEQKEAAQQALSQSTTAAELYPPGIELKPLTVEELNNRLNDLRTSISEKQELKSNREEELQAHTNLLYQVLLLGTK